MDEFELIRRYFDRDPGSASVVVGVGDDGAVLTPQHKQQQVQVIDTLVEGVHFPAGTSAADIAYRAVAVNLSDIAAMGAKPRWMLLALTLTDADKDWVESFASGLFQAADEFDVDLVGGDTTRGPVLTISVCITGEVGDGGALLRSGANPDDSIFVTGSLGDAALGLRLLQRGEKDEFLSQRFLRPTPRLSTGRALIGKASAAIDLSDGLAADLGKLLAASGVGGEIDIASLPQSEAMRAREEVSDRYELALCGGDDYELCFTAPADAVSSMSDITRIGRVTKTPGLVCRLNGDIVDVDGSGYRHFI